VEPQSSDEEMPVSRLRHPLISGLAGAGGPGALPQPAPGLSFPLEVPMDIGSSLCCAEDHTSNPAKLGWTVWGCFPKSCWLL